MDTIMSSNGNTEVTSDFYDLNKSRKSQEDNVLSGLILMQKQ